MDILVPPCRCGLEYPPGTCPRCDRPEPSSAAGVRSLARSLELHRRERQRRRRSARPLLEGLAELAFERALRGEREEAEALFEEGFDRSRPEGYPGDRFMLAIARTGHLCRDWEEPVLEWLDEGMLRFQEWRPGRSAWSASRRLQAYRAVMAARLGRCREVRPVVKALLKGGAPADIRLRLAEALLWCGPVDRARLLLDRMLQGRTLEEDDRHIAYVLMIDCAESLGDAQEKARWIRRERAWCRRHGRMPYGSADSPATASATWVLESGRRSREVLDPGLARRVRTLREALDLRSDSPQALRLRVCRDHPFLAVKALARLREMDVETRRGTLEFVRLFHGRLQVGPLLLALGPLPEARPQLLGWLDDFQLGAYAQRALRECGTVKSLESRALQDPGSPGSQRAAAALGSLSGRAAGNALRRLLEVPGLQVAAALGLADRAEGGVLRRVVQALEAAAPAARPWLALAAARLEAGEATSFDWRLDFRPDPGRSRHRLLSHPIEEVLRGYPPLEFSESRLPDASHWEEWLQRARRLEPACDVCGRREGRPSGATACLCQYPRVRRWLAHELRRWSAAGARSLEEILDLLEELDSRQGPFTAGWDVAIPLRAPGGLNGPRTLGTACRWLVARGYSGLEEASRSLKQSGAKAIDH